jgi:hypothetical protein
MRISVVIAALMAAYLYPTTAQQNLFPSDLSPYCSEQLCDVFKYITTCPMFGIGWDGVCADYFVGFLFSCPGYPSKEDIYDAPSICLPEYISLIAALKQGQKPVDVQTIAAGNYSEYCYEACYQNFVTAAAEYNANCPLGNLSAISFPTNSFRGIACGTYYSYLYCFFDFSIFL